MNKYSNQRKFKRTPAENKSYITHNVKIQRAPYGSGVKRIGLQQRSTKLVGKGE